jgi:hypothetical protein
MHQNLYPLRQILRVPTHTDQLLSSGFRYVLMIFCLFGLTGAAGPTEKGSETELKVGIVQRFGEAATDQLTLQASKGDRLTLRFLGGNLKPQNTPPSSGKPKGLRSKSLNLIAGRYGQNELFIKLLYSDAYCCKVFKRRVRLKRFT